MLTKKKKRFAELSSRWVSHIMKPSPNRNFQLLLTNPRYLRSSSTYKYIKALIMCFLIYSVTLKPVGVSCYRSLSGSNLLPLTCLPRTPLLYQWQELGPHIHHKSVTNEGKEATIPGLDKSGVIAASHEKALNTSSSNMPLGRNPARSVSTTISWVLHIVP